MLILAATIYLGIFGYLYYKDRETTKAKKTIKFLEKYIEAQEITIEELQRKIVLTDEEETNLINEYNDKIWRLQQQIMHLEDQLEFRESEKL